LSWWYARSTAGLWASIRKKGATLPPGASASKMRLTSGLALSSETGSMPITSSVARPFRNAELHWPSLDRTPRAGLAEVGNGCDKSSRRDVGRRPDERERARQAGKRRLQRAAGLPGQPGRAPAWQDESGGADRGRARRLFQHRLLHPPPPT